MALRNTHMTPLHMIWQLLTPILESINMEKDREAERHPVELRQSGLEIKKTYNLITSRVLTLTGDSK